MLVDKPLLLPSPVETASRLFFLIKSGAVLGSALPTVARVLSGYVAALLVGVLLAVPCALSPWFDRLMRPIRAAIKATPVSSFIILVMLWLTVGVVPAFISFLMVLPIVWTNVQKGLAETDGALLEMARMYRFGRVKTLLHIYAPSAMPHFAAACATGFGFAWKAGIAAEVIARPEFSVGKKLLDAKIYIETPDLFAWTLLVVLLSMLMERGVLAVCSAFPGKGGARHGSV